MDHLERGGYPDRVLESLGRALVVKPSVAFWDRLKAGWLGAARDSGEGTCASLVLAACATKARFDDLVAFLAVAERGESRNSFVRPVLRLGGDRGREAVEALRDDSVLGKEATVLLKRRKYLGQWRGAPLRIVVIKICFAASRASPVDRLRRDAQRAVH